MDLGARTAEAAAKAAAGTGAIRGVEDTARKLTAGAVDVGRGYPAAITASAGQGVQAGSAAQQGTNQAFGTGAEAMGTGPQWLGGSNQALANWGNTLNQQYQNQLGQFNANQQSSSGFGNIFGTLLGAGMKMYGFEEGGVVPPDISPSRGAVDDDVPAAVSVGEVIVPSDVVNWLGEKHFSKLAEKARKEKSEIRAAPTDDAGVKQYAQGGVVEPDIPGYQPPGRGSIWSGPPGVQPLPGIISAPDIPGPGPLPGPPIRNPGWPDIPGPGPIRGRPIRNPGWPDIPGPGPLPGPPIRNPGRGVKPLPPVWPTPGPPGGGWVPLPRGEYPTYPGHPRGPGWDGRGVRMSVDPSLYPNQAVPTGRWAGR